MDKFMSIIGAIIIIIFFVLRKYVLLSKDLVVSNFVVLIGIYLFLTFGIIVLLIGILDKKKLNKEAHKR